MTGNFELLNYIHQNTEMGISTINQLIGVVKDEEFKKTLESQYNEYKRIYDMSESKIKEHNEDVKDIGKMSKATAYMMIGMKTLTDKSPSHISEMLIQGSTMGIIDITKNINKYNGEVAKDILEMANDLLVFEQRNVEELKKYLN